MTYDSSSCSSNINGISCAAIKGHQWTILRATLNLRFRSIWWDIGNRGENGKSHAKKEKLCALKVETWMFNWIQLSSLTYMFLPQLYDALIQIINYNSGKNLSFAFAWIRCRRDFFSLIFEVILCSWSFIYIRTRIRQLMSITLILRAKEKLFQNVSSTVETHNNLYETIPMLCFTYLSSIKMWFVYKFDLFLFEIII